MSSQPPNKPQGPPNTAHSLPNPYAASSKGLPNPYSAHTISQPAVIYTEEDRTKAAQQKIAHAFHVPQSIKRPQPKKASAAVKKPVMAPVASTQPATTNPATTNPATAKPGIDFYRSTYQDDQAAIEERRQRNWAQIERTKANKKRAKQFGSWFPDKSHGYPKPAATQDDAKTQRSNMKAFLATDAHAHQRAAFRAVLKAAAQGTSIPPPPPPAADDEVATPPPPPPAANYQVAAPPPPPPAANYQVAAGGAALSAAAIYDNATISAPAVLYHPPDALEGNVGDESASYGRPAKRVKLNVAEAMMAKMGYKKGQGLGKNNDGIISHIEVTKRKVPNRVNDEGGSRPGQQVYDLKGADREQKEEPSKFGEPSAVVVTWGCVDQVDWAADAERNDGGVRQEMGEAFSRKFGPVEQLRVDEDNADGVVYILFNSELAALNAVNRFDEGWEFRGRKIKAQYYNGLRFRAGILDY